MGSAMRGRANFLTRTWYLKQKNQLYIGAYQPLETWQKIDSTLMLVRRICEAFSNQVFLSWEPMVKVSPVTKGRFPEEKNAFFGTLPE